MYFQKQNLKFLMHQKVHYYEDDHFKIEQNFFNIRSSLPNLIHLAMCLPLCLELLKRILANTKRLSTKALYMLSRLR